MSDWSWAFWSTWIFAPSPDLIGWSRRIRYAVITLATLAIGAAFWAPDVPNEPMPWTSSAPWPEDGHGMEASPPPKV